MRDLSFQFFSRFLFSKNSGSITKTISWLCLGGIAVSIMAMVVVISVMSGFGKAIEDRLLQFEPHLVIRSQAKDAPEARRSLFDLREKLKKNQEIRVFFFDQEQVIFRTPNGNYSGALARGLEEVSLKHFIQASNDFSEKNVKRHKWEVESEETITIKDSDIFVGYDLSITSGIYPGTELTLTPPESLLLPKGEVPQISKLSVQDILRTGFQSIDSQILLYKKRDSGSLFNESIGKESLLEVYLNDPSLLAKVVSQIDKKEFSIQTWKERNSSLFYSLKMEKLLISIFLFLAVLIGSFTIVTIIILLITQKKKEIGVLMALGMRQQEIIKIFSKIGFYLSSLGILIGFVLGVAICILISTQTLFLLPDFYQDRTIPVRFEFLSYFYILFLSLIFGYLSSYYPSKLISTIAPQDIFRSK